MAPMNPRLLRPTAAGGFNPTRLANLLLWLDASDASTVTLDTGVSEWRDKSGTGQKFTQDTGGNQPAYLTNGIGGKPALGFTASSSHFMRGTFSHALTGITSLVVATMESATQNNGRMFSLTVAGASNADFAGTGHLAPTKRSGTTQAVACQHDGASRASVSIAGYSTPFIQCSHHDGTTLSNRVNNGTAATHTFGAPPWSATFTNMMLSTFNATATPSAFLTGKIAEVIVYGRDLTADERAAVHKYLGSKYGITVS
jgi:hypothetical protein